MKHVSKVIFAAACLSLVAACAGKSGSPVAEKKATSTSTELKADEASVENAFIGSKSQGAHGSVRMATVVIQDPSDAKKTITLLGEFDKSAKRISTEVALNSPVEGVSGKVICAEGRDQTCDLAIAMITYAKTEKSEAKTVVKYFQHVDASESDLPMNKKYEFVVDAPIEGKDTKIPLTNITLKKSAANMFAVTDLRQAYDLVDSVLRIEDKKLGVPGKLAPALTSPGTFFSMK